MTAFIKPVAEEELTATKRLSHKWMMRGSLSYNDYTEHCGPNSFANPTPSNRAPSARNTRT